VVTGITGADEVTGITGTDGVTGVTGITGVTGVTGTDGVTGVTGVTVTVCGLGRPSDVAVRVSRLLQVFNLGRSFHRLLLLAKKRRVVTQNAKAITTAAANIAHLYSLISFFGDT
jgi:hypothetical protein